MKTQQEQFTQLTYRSVYLFSSRVKELIRQNKNIIYKDLQKKAKEEYKKDDLKWLIVYS